MITSLIDFITFVYTYCLFIFFLFLGTPAHRIPEPEQSSSAAKVITRDQKN